MQTKTKICLGIIGVSLCLIGWRVVTTSRQTEVAAEENDPTAQLMSVTRDQGKFVALRLDATTTGVKRVTQMKVETACWGGTYHETADVVVDLSRADVKTEQLADHSLQVTVTLDEPRVESQVGYNPNNVVARVDKGISQKDKGLAKQVAIEEAVKKAQAIFVSNAHIEEAKRQTEAILRDLYQGLGIQNLTLVWKSPKAYR